MGDRVLVTGASGFTGSRLCRRLMKEGYKVRAFVRNESAAKEQVRDLADKGAEVIKGDLLNNDDARSAVDGADTVYHIAALYRQEGVTERVFWDTNVTGTKNMVEASIESGVKRFIHCSTVGVHGDIKDPPAAEDALLSPGDPYQESKLEGEKLVWRYIKEGKLSGVIFRPSGIYGPGDTRFLKLFRTVARRRFVMIGKGDVYYHMTYIDDLIDGILLCGTNDDALKNIFILAGPEYTTLKEMISTVADTLGVSLPGFRIPVWPVYLGAWFCEKTFKPLGLEPPLYRRRVDFFTKSRAFDISKARRVLGFNPRVSLNEGIRLTAEWYKKNNLL